jgi:polyisoprenoid-binding protein YceI
MTIKTMMLVAALVLSSGAAQASDWVIDSSHSAAQFSVKHMMVSTVRGQFDKVTGTVELDEKDPTKSKIDVVIDAKTINTRDAKRDAHLKAADFFDVEKHPTLTFKSTQIEKAADGKLKATGDLTMRGVTKPVTLMVEPLSAAVKNPWGQTVRGVSATGKLSRKDWGLTWNKALETGGMVVGDEVTLIIDAELNPKSAAVKAGSK